jgi:predicted enzyme related to lactoylglutathione lyase
MHEMEKPLTRTYVRVPDAEAAVKRAEALGAKVGLPPMNIPGHGTIAIYFIGGVEQGVWEMPR